MTAATIDRLIGENIVITTGDPAKTRITFADGTTEEYDWSGDFTEQNWISAGIWNDNLEWVKDPVTITFGTAVKRIVGNEMLGISDSLTTVVFTGLTDIAGQRTFDGDDALTSVTFSSSIQNIGYRAFQRCPVLQSVIFKGKTLAQVQGMTNYPWSISDTSIISVEP